MLNTTIAHYQITAKLGQGGMGEVYRATDTKLGREVAIKVLPEAFTSDGERVARFQREAEILAVLNHPNIASIFCLEETGGGNALILELIEGETLAQRLKKGPLPVEECLEVCKQIAEALESAHDKGVIHRDLKPGNIKFAQGEKVMVLDFGLAKSLSEVHSMELDTGQVDSATITDNCTKPGTILGTAAYMSPEQARGKPVDKGSDIWSFGCVLYECLTGKRGFNGEDVSETLAKIIGGEPDWAVLPESTPPTIRLLLRKCLTRDRKLRLQDIGDARVDLEQVLIDPNISSLTGLTVPQDLKMGTRVPRSAVACLVLAGFVVGWLLKPTPLIPAWTNSASRKIEIYLPSPRVADSTDEEIIDMAIAPDGRKFVFVNSDGLWLRWLDRVSPSVLLVRKTDERIRGPFWSPESKEVGFFSESNLYRIDIAGGQAELVSETTQVLWARGAGGAWFADDQIIFTFGVVSDLYQVPSRSGEPTMALTRGEHETGLMFASPLPDSRGVLFVGHGETGPDAIDVWTRDGKRKQLLHIPGSHLWHPVFHKSGYVVYGRSREKPGIWALPFSLDGLEGTGEPILIDAQGANPSVAADGALLINLTEEKIRQLVWMDRDGQIIQEIGQPMRGLSSPRLSHDERRIAISVRQDSTWQIQIVDVEQGVLVPEIEIGIDPYWFPSDSRRIAFRRWIGGGQGMTRIPRVFVKSLDGSREEEEMFEGFCEHVSRSGKYLLVAPAPDSETGCAYASLEGPDPTMLIPFPKHMQDLGRRMRLSPNDQLLAFNSSKTGQNEVWVVDFPSFSNRRIVSSGGGDEFEWEINGSDLFYLRADARSMWSVSNLQHGTTSGGDRTEVFNLPEGVSKQGFQVARDGQRFLMLKNISEPPGPDGLRKAQALLIENRFEEFREKQ